MSQDGTGLHPMLQANGYVLQAANRRVLGKLEGIEWTQTGS